MSGVGHATNGRRLGVNILRGVITPLVGGVDRLRPADHLITVRSCSGIVIFPVMTAVVGAHRRSRAAVVSTQLPLCSRPRRVKDVKVPGGSRSSRALRKINAIGATKTRRAGRDARGLGVEATLIISMCWSSSL